MHFYSPPSARLTPQETLESRQEGSGVTSQAILPVYKVSILRCLYHSSIQDALSICTWRSSVTGLRDCILINVYLGTLQTPPHCSNGLSHLPLLPGKLGGQRKDLEENSRLLACTQNRGSAPPTVSSASQYSPQAEIMAWTEVVSL